MADYKIGQVLFLVPRTKMAVLPMQVDRILSETSLSEGTQVRYVVRSVANKTYDLETIEADVYTDPEEVRKILTEGALAVINRTVDKAVESGEKFLYLPVSPPAEPQEAPDDAEE